MRLSELGRESGVSVATIKFYLREGLLRPGTPINARQSSYDASHVRRLRLVRAMQQVGGMSVDQVRNVLNAAVEGSLSRHERLGVAQYSLPPHVPAPDDDPSWHEVRAEVVGLMAAMGWRVNDFSPSLDALTRAVVALRRLGYRGGTEDLRHYAEAVHPLAEREYAVIEEHTELDEAIEATVAYTVLYEPILLAIRRLAHEDVGARIYDREPMSPPHERP